MAVKLDWSQADSAGFEPLDPGRYKVVVFDVVQKDGRDSGEPYFEWTLKVDGSNRRVWHNTTLQPQAIFGLKNMLIGLGWDGDRITSFSDPGELLQAIRQELMGREAFVTVEKVPRRDGNGMTNRVTKVESLEAAAAPEGAAAGGKLW
jgi:hypothetical protein